MSLNLTYRLALASLMLAGAQVAVAADPHAGHAHQHAPAAKKAASPTASAKVLVEDPWVRATVKGQSGTGGFMRLSSADGATLVGFASPVARTAELHEMKMEGDVMRMRPVEALSLPAGQVVELKPGSYHLMLMNLKEGLKAGDRVRLTLKFKDKDGKAFEQTLDVPINSAQPVAPTGGGMQHHHH